MNIISAITDTQLFRPFLEDGRGKLGSWTNWGQALRCLYGLPVKSKHADLVKQCTGRSLDKLPAGGFNTGLFLTGRRSGKSRIAAVIGAYEAALSGKEKLLAKGEQGLVAVVAPTAKQGRIIKNYTGAILHGTSLLKNEVVKETREGFLLSNKIQIEILIGDWRSIRGYTVIAAIVDEVCFFGLSEESRVKNDAELIRAIRPSLSTVGGRLIAISSPYAQKGWAYQTYKKHFGNNESSTLVWNCGSRVMNPTLDQSIIDAALEEDLQSAKSEYLGEFRDDIVVWLPREAIESVVKKCRLELLPKSDTRYFAFVDVSGGRSDAAALAIAHAAADNVIIDFVKNYAAPHSPFQIINQMAEILHRYGVKSVTGDNYSAEFVASAFKSKGFGYSKSPLPKSALYLELLPTICSARIELLDNELLVNQLASLERRTRSGGKDTVNHPPGGHDDLANAVAGVNYLAGRRGKHRGPMFARPAIIDL
jgi:hypothetical protein